MYWGRHITIIIVIYIGYVSNGAISNLINVSIEQKIIKVEKTATS